LNYSSEGNRYDENEECFLRTIDDTKSHLSTQMNGYAILNFVVSSE